MNDFGVTGTFIKIVFIGLIFEKLLADIINIIYWLLASIILNTMKYIYF